MRNLQIGDIVNVSFDKVAELSYVPNFPKKVTSTKGVITSNWRVLNTNDKVVLVKLDMCPEIKNLDFHVDDVDLLIPVELHQRLTAIEDRLDALEKKD